MVGSLSRDFCLALIINQINLVFMTTITARWYLLKLARLRKITELPRPGLSGNWHAHHGPRPSQGGLRRQDSDEELIVRPRPTLRANVYRSIGTL